jgi:hypothetical protein
MQGIVAFAQSSSHRTRQRHWEIVAVWQPERNPADTKACRISRLSTRLPVAPQGQGVLALPGLSAASGGVVVLVTLVDTTGLLAGGGKTASLTVLVHRVDDPVDAGVTADGLVLRVDEDDLVVLVGGVLVDPVGVQDAQVGATATDTLLSGGLEGALVLELVDTLVGGLACAKGSALVNFLLLLMDLLTVSGTLGGRALATTTADTGAVDNVSLLGLVTQTASLVGTAGAGGAVDDVQLAELYESTLSKCSTSTPRHKRTKRHMSLFFR